MIFYKRRTTGDEYEKKKMLKMKQFEQNDGL